MRFSFRPSENARKMLAALLVFGGILAAPLSPASAGWDDHPDADVTPDKAPRRVRKPGVEATAQIAVKVPSMRHVFLSAELCVANDRLLEVLSAGGSPKDAEAEVARVKKALRKNGTPEPLACAGEDVKNTWRCLTATWWGDKAWCRENARTDMFVRALEIETDGGPFVKIPERVLKRYASNFAPRTGTPVRTVDLLPYWVPRAENATSR